MKKNLCISAIFMVMTLGLVSCQKKETFTTVRLNEVVHSIFYAPQYVAIEKGFFKEQGLEIELSVGQGADKSMTALLTNSADIALLGTEAGIYVYNEGKEDYPKSFAQLTQRAGNFLVSRESEKDFTWDKVKGKTIIGGRAGGMPQMILEYVLKSKNIEIGKDVEMVNNIQFTSTSGAFIGGVGDYTAEFDPAANAIEKEGKGYVVASLGIESGKVPYTVYMTTQNYIENNSETLQKFTNAIYKSQLWVENHTSKEIAEVIAPHFKESDLGSLEFMIERYKAQGTWKNNPVFDEEGFTLIQDILDESGALSKRIPYNDLINTEFAKKAMENVK